MKCGSGLISGWYRDDFAHKEDMDTADSAEVWVECTGPEMTSEAF